MRQAARAEGGSVVMIILNERFSCKRDAYCWVLFDKAPGQKLDAKTYHANLEQVCKVVLDKMCGECSSVAELLAMLRATQTALHAAVVARNQEDRDAAA